MAQSATHIMLPGDKYTNHSCTKHSNIRCHRKHIYQLCRGYTSLFSLLAKVKCRGHKEKSTALCPCYTKSSPCHKKPQNFTQDQRNSFQTCWRPLQHMLLDISNGKDSWMDNVKHCQEWGQFAPCPCAWDKPSGKQSRSIWSNWAWM